MRKYKRMIFDGTTYIEARYADYLELERKKDAAIHLHRESELMEEIERLKTEMTVLCVDHENEVSRLKAERVDQLILIEYVLEQLSIYVDKEWIQEKVKQFNKEK